MNTRNWGALACALAVTGVTAPAAAARAQDQEPLVRALQLAGRGSRIGVTIRDADGKDVKAGVTVEAVTPGGPADRAGLKEGDTIAEFDGERVRSRLQFSRLVSETPEERSVPVVVVRGGQRLTLNVTPERVTFGDEFGFRLLPTPPARLARPALPPEPPEAPSAPRAPRPPEFLTPATPFEFMDRLRSSGRLGVSLESVDAQLAEYFGVKEGALVKSVAAGSSAAKAGVKAGDVITSVNGRHVYEASDVARALDRLEDGGEFTIEVTRNRKPQTVKGTLEAPQGRRRTVMETIF